MTLSFRRSEVFELKLILTPAAGTQYGYRDGWDFVEHGRKIKQILDASGLNLRILVTAWGIMAGMHAFLLCEC